MLNMSIGFIMGAISGVLLYAIIILSKDEGGDK